MVKCDDCGMEVITRIYWKGKDRCEGCDRKFDPEYFNYLHEILKKN